MSGTQKESNVHKVKIQQTYWAKDTTEEKLIEMGAIRTGQVAEEEEYYDTDLYDLAVNESWLSKTGTEWQLITDKMKATIREANSPTQKSSGRTGNAKTTNSRATLKHDAQKADPRGDPETSRYVPHYELVEEREILACLTRILHLDVELANLKMGSFLEMAGIQKYTSVNTVTQETFRLRDIYTIVLKADGNSTKKAVLISLDVKIDNVTRGFQRIEQLANELDLQAQRPPGGLTASLHPQWKTTTFHNI